MATRSIELRLNIGQAEHRAIASCRLAEGISETTFAEIEIATPEDVAFDEAVGAKATLSLLLDGEEARRWTLTVGRARFVGIRAGLLRYALSLHDPMWPLRFIKNTRKFRKLSAADIVQKILGEGGVACSLRTTRPTAVRNYCAQYRETNLDFVRRLLEFEGIYFTFDADGGAVLADESSSSPNVPGQSEFELLDAAGALHRDELGIHEFRLGSRLASGTATVSDYDWKKPGQPLRRERSAERDEDLATYDYPAGYRDPAEGELLARLRLEAHRVRARYVDGKSNVVAFAPAHVFRFGSDAGEMFAAEYLLVAVEHVFENAAFADAGERGADSDAPGTTYANTFHAIPKSVPFRPALVTARPTVAGSHTVLVRGPAGSEIHTDTHGRFRAQFHWDREATGTDQDSRWIRMLQESASSMTLARVGWEVAVSYIDGDADRPVGVARQINGQMTPAYAQPAAKTVMAIKTPSSPASGGYNEIKLDDSAGAMLFDVRAQKDMVGIVKHDKTERVGNDELHLVGANFTHVVQRDQTVTIGGDSTTTVNGSATLQIKKNRTKSVGGGETVDTGAAEVVGTSGSEAERVGGVRLTIAGSVGPPDVVGMAKSEIPSPLGAAKSVAMGALSGGAAGAEASLKGMIPSVPSLDSLVASMCQGSIVRQAQASVSRMVGGGFVSIAVGNVSTAVERAYAETVGGVKLTLAGGDISTKVDGALVTTVGAAVMRAATDDMSLSSKTSRVTVGGLARLDSAQKVVIEGASISITAAAGLKLKVGSLEISLEPGSVSMKGDVKIEAGSTLTYTGQPDDLTAA